MSKNTKKIAIAMSGGVDSSVVAALLKEQGYNVFGVFFHLWNDDYIAQSPASVQQKAKACCSLEAQTDARRVAQQIGIPFYTLNLKDHFTQEVVKTTIEQYQQGITPNPCVRCNSFVKFGEALEQVKKLGATHMATGHYAQIVTDAQGVCHLHTSPDDKKDQTYFLHRLTQDQLRHVLFPVGHLTKNAVRALAEKFQLPTAKKIESQDLCFVAGGKLTDFVQERSVDTPGDIIDFKTNKVLGQHGGVLGFTIGQRQGLGLPGGPWYVYRVDVKKNQLLVTTDESLLGEKVMRVKEVNWITGEPALPLTVDCRIRYRSQSAPATVTRTGDDVIVTFETPQRAVTPGQAAVFYLNEECLGGGVIDVSDKIH
jgi:tRNA-specific 2-thiouridylase